MERTDSKIDPPVTRECSRPVPAGEVIAEAVSMLMDAGVHPVEIRKHLQTETAWIDREMARLDQAA